MRYYFTQLSGDAHFSLAVLTPLTTDDYVTALPGIL